MIHAYAPEIQARLALVAELAKHDGCPENAEAIAIALHELQRRGERIAELEERLRTHDGWCDAVGQEPYLTSRICALEAENARLKRVVEAADGLAAQADRVGRKIDGYDSLMEDLDTKVELYQEARRGK